MLAGGTAPITPQAGGGAVDAPPPGYNPNVSLLNGGTAQITPQAGGAPLSEKEAETFANRMFNDYTERGFTFYKDSRESVVETIKQQLLAGEGLDKVYENLPGKFPFTKSAPPLSPSSSGASGVSAALGPSSSPQFFGTSSDENESDPPVPIASASAFGLLQRPVATPPTSPPESPKAVSKGVTFAPGTKGAPSAFSASAITGPIEGLAQDIQAVVPTAEDAKSIEDPRLTLEQQKVIDDVMRNAFQRHFEQFGKEELRTGQKTLEEVSKECAAAAVSAGTLLAQSFLKELAAGPGPEPDEDDKFADRDGLEYKPFTRILNPSDVTKDPFYIEYYRVLETSPSEAGDLQYMIDNAKRNIFTPQWKKDLLRRMDSYEQNRLNTLWRPTSTGRGGGMREPLLARPGYSLTSAQILTQFDRASYELPSTMTEGLTVIAAPPVRGDVQKFLRILTALQRISVLYVGIDETVGKPKVVLKPGVVLTFMPPFYDPRINYIKGSVETASNILLLSHFLDLNESNPQRVFVLPENTTDNYAVGVMFHTYRGKRDAPLLNFLEPSYIYFKSGVGLLLSASSTDVEKDLPTREAGPPRIFKPQPTADGVLTEDTLVIRGDVENKQSFTIPKPLETGGSNCVMKGLVKRTDVRDIKGPIYLKPIQLEDTIGSEHIDDILLAIRLIYDTSQADRAICEYSGSKLIQPPMPPDQFYASKSVKTKGVFFTEVNFFESISKAERSPYYLIRKPTMGTEVYSDWLKLKFTVDEASLLNGIGLTPKILEEIFGPAWPNELANFLQGISITKCFTDTRLMLRAECEDNRKFLEQVRIYYAQKNLSVEAIQDKREKEMKDEVKRYFEDLEASMGGPSTFPAEDDMAEISNADFLKYKKRMDTLFVYYEVPTAAEGAQTVNTNIIVANREGDYKYYKLFVPKVDYDRDPFILYKKIQEKRKKYPSLSFIY